MTASAETKLLSNHQAPLRQQKGYSIIELSIALAIISIILVTALAGVQRILRSNSVNEDLKNLSLMASKTAVILTNVADTAGITQDNLISLRVFEGFRNNSGTINNAFGGVITVKPNSEALGTRFLQWEIIAFDDDSVTLLHRDSKAKKTKPLTQHESDSKKSLKLFVAPTGNSIATYRIHTGSELNTPQRQAAANLPATPPSRPANN
jgi:prepilin-type N-terminal cleavage/methylation domain-containing protein